MKILIVFESVTKCKYANKTIYAGRFFKCYEIVFTDYLKGLRPVGEAYRNLYNQSIWIFNLNDTKTDL